MNPPDQSNEPDLHCVSYRCRLCRFPIRAGEAVIADVGDGKLTPSFPFKWNAHYEKDFHMVLQGCHLLCTHDEDEQLPAYHAECLRFAPPLTKEGLRVTEYTYQPTPSEHLRRASRIRDVAGRRLQMECPNLPAEVCLLITEGLVRECASTVTHGLLQGRSLEALDSELDVSLGVWARYTLFDGIRYVESLSNVGDSQSVLLLDAGRASAAELLYVLEDHLGIRQVVFASYEHSVKLSALLCKSKPDAWWQTIPITPEKLTVKSDGLKLRSIFAPSTRDSPYSPTVTWSKPMAPFQEPMFAFGSKTIRGKPIDDPSCTHLRIVSLDFNDPAITGYSVCWLRGIMGIHAHRGMEKLAAYDGLDQCHEKTTWVYIPIDHGERITGIWTRDASHGDDTGIMFQTNQGRRVVIGHCTNSKDERIDSARHWEELSNVSENRFRVHYQLSYRGVETLIAQPLSGLEPTFDGKAMPPCPSRRYRPIQRRHYSSADLENVVEIIPCWREISPNGATYWAMTGLLLRYANGSQACVGEFRMDSLGKPINVDGALYLYLGHGEDTDDTYWYLTKIYTEPTDDDDDLAWWCLKMEGKLQWWFGNNSQVRISTIDYMGETHWA